MNIKSREILSLILAIAVAGTVHADSDRTIRIVGRKTVVVTTGAIRLSDLADVSSPRIEDDETVIGLKKIFIEKSPNPGDEVTLSAAQVLEKIRDQGVDLNQVGYTFPRMLNIKRASRTLMLDEVANAISSLLTSSGRDLKLKKVEYANDREIAPGMATVEASELGSITPGRITFGIKAKVENENVQQFSVDALVDEFKQIPVARRTITKGATVSDDDVVMARFNISSLPRDIAGGDTDVIGRAATHDIAAGEVFRTGKLEIPQAIATGDKVTVVYRGGLLEASATGIALEGGTIGQEIKVRNEISKKTISGRVLEPGLVGINR